METLPKALADEIESLEELDARALKRKYPALLSDAGDCSASGILRCIVSDPDKAYKELKAAHFTVKITDVIGFVCPNTSGSLAKVLKHLSDNGIFIEYVYSFANGDVAHVVVRPTDLQACDRVLAEKKVELMAASDLYKL